MKLAPASSAAALIADQQVGLFLDRHLQRVLLDRRLPAHFADALRGASCTGSVCSFALALAMATACRAAWATPSVRHVVGRREAPGAVGDHPHADAGTIRC